MIFFTLTRMWLYHGKLQDKMFSEFTDTLAVKGQTILQKQVNFTTEQTVQGTLIAKWKDFSVEQGAGHNLYPGIDIVPDDPTLKLLQNYLIENSEGCSLFDCCFRITDYGYLNVVLSFKSENVSGLNYLYDSQTLITRKINAWISTLDDVLFELQKQGYVNISDDYFGIPAKVKDFLNIDYTDMYTYQDITILTKESNDLVQEIRELYLINDEPEKIEYYEVHNIALSPIVYVDKDLDAQSIYDIIEPYNLALAELNTYDSVSHLNYAIINLMNVAAMNKSNKNKSSEKNKLLQAYKGFASSDIRKITMNTHYILHCINFRKSALLSWQYLFLRRLKEKEASVENKENYECSEKIIVQLIDEKTQEMQNQHSTILEVLFLFLSVITIYSTYIDIATFLDSEHSNFSKINGNTLEIKLIVTITIILIIIFLYVARLKRKRDI